MSPFKSLYELIKKIVNLSMLEMGIATIIAIILGTIIGASYSAITGKNDTAIEEAAEDIVEYEAENLLHLSHGTLKDKINLDMNPEEVTTDKKE